MRRVKIAILFIIFPVFVWAQGGGKSSFQFLNMGNSARIASLGTDYLSVMDGDISLSLSNPSLINREIHNHLAFNFVNYVAGINYGFASYSRTFDKVGSFAAHLQYGSYGRTEQTDEFGNITGTIANSDFSFVLGWGRSLDTHFSIGANFKFIYSQIDVYNAMAIGVDVSATYTNSNRNFATSLLLRNIGVPLKNYHKGGHDRLPFEVAVALSQKIPHAPLRIHIMATNLQKWDLRFEDPAEEGSNANLQTGEVKKQNGALRFFDNVMRHIVVGLEIIPYKGFYLRASYNYLRSQDLSLSSRPGIVGFSWGVGIRVYKMNFSYARAAYHLVGSPNYISFSLNLDAFNKR
ncbi:MAG: type IX secretion system protein PorQ [Bacteroidales bacterium]